MNTTLRIAADACPASYENKLPYLSVHCEGALCQVSGWCLPVCRWNNSEGSVRKSIGFVVDRCGLSVCRVVVWQSLSKPCDSSAECASGSECVSLFDEPAFMSLLHSVKLTGDDDGSDLETCGGGAGLQKDVSGPQTQCDGDVGAQQILGADW